MFSSDKTEPIGGSRGIGPDHPDYCPPISNMVAMCDYTQPGSKNLATPVFYAPNAASMTGNFPANTFKTNLYTILQYTKTVLMIGACTEPENIRRFHIFRFTMGTLPHPLYEQELEGSSAMDTVEHVSQLGTESVVGQVLLGPAVSIDNLSIRNAVVVGGLSDVGLNLSGIYDAYKGSCSYDPDRFPGLKLDIPLPPEYIQKTSLLPCPGPTNVSMNIFNSGRGLLIGHVTRAQIAFAFREAKRIVADHKCPFVPDTPSGRNNMRNQNFYKRAHAAKQVISSELEDVDNRILQLNARFQQELIATACV